MTREEFSNHIEGLSLHLTYPELDHLHAINESDAEQREEIDRAHQTNEYLASQIRQWENICGEKQEEIGGRDQIIRNLETDYILIGTQNREQKDEIARLREVLQALVDVQNGPPLEKYRAEWELAMQKSLDVLKEMP